MFDQAMTPPTLELDGVRLRPLLLSDAPALFEHLSDPLVTGLTSFPDPTLFFAESMIQKSQCRWAAGEIAKWAIARSEDDRLIGTCGFNENSPVHRWAELAYDLSPSYWGKGLMRRAVSSLLDWIFSLDRFDRIHAFVRLDNVRSAGLLQRLGFRHEGCLRSYRICRGKAFDFAVYGLLRSEWAATR